MINSEVQQGMDEKLEALGRALEEAEPPMSTHSKDRIVAALVDLFREIWPAIQTSYPGLAQFITRYRPIHEIVGTPQPESGSAWTLSTVEAARAPGENASESSSADIEELFMVDAIDTGNSNQSGQLQPDQFSPEGVSAIDSLVPEIGINAALQACGPNLSNRELDDLLALADSFSGIGDLPPAEDFDYSLFVTQSPAGVGLEVPPLPSVGSSSDWITDNIMADNISLDLADATSTDHNMRIIESEAETTNITFDKPRHVVDLDSPVSVGEDFPVVVQAMQDCGSSACAREAENEICVISAHSEKGLDINRMVEETGLALLKGDDISLDWIPPNDHFQCAWGVFSGQDLKVMLHDLLHPSRMISELTVDYFARKLFARQAPPGSWVGREHELDKLTELRYRKLVILIREAEKWSLIEVQLYASKVIHYNCYAADQSTTPSWDHSGCSSCLRIGERVMQLLHQQQDAVMPWENLASNITTSAPDIAWLIWTTRVLAAEQIDLSLLTTTEYRFELAQEILFDLKAAQTAQLTVMSRNYPALANDEQTLAAFYMDMGARTMCGDQLWRIVQGLAESEPGRQQLGLQRAAELFQLAIGVASPEALTMLKGCLRELRSQSQPPDEYPETAGGVFRALQAFSKKSHLSSVGLRLAQWKLHRMKKGSESFAKEIALSIAPGKEAPTSAEISRVLAGYNKGVYWNNLVEAAGKNDPNILCLIPPIVVGPPPWLRNFRPTAYRDMPIAEKAILGTILWKLKRQIFMGVDTNLSSVLLYMRPPADLYPLEETSDESILQNDSLSFDPHLLRGPGRV
ncbi:uncharacterized protein LDX57_009333 [Aspergillus melleus]|uniref:uncharacterized protein n=1 Tax=Aspergillus melleus TaxID=138277 RepID=UPI001E8DA43E|nr:uncharacterized protein LDX57_009333 [Aspergillus melleus]KAH8431679.1 hypothetical protein LDX57_009333 [Aspergillus melleus]